MDTLVSTKKSVGDESLFEESYVRIAPELTALAPDALLSINLDIPTAVSTALGVLPEMVALRTDIVNELPGFDVVQFDKLEDYAMALSHANTQHLIATQPPDDLQSTIDEGMAVRETLLADVTTLIRRRFINEATIKDLRGANGYKNIAIDLQILASILKDNWSSIDGKCGVQLSELDHAQKLAARILRVVGLREQGPALQAATADMRVRAFTLFSRAYDNARRAVIFLRWHEGDADCIAPSLYAGRSNGRRKATEATTENTSTSTTGTGATVNPSPTGNSPAAPAAANPTASPDISESGPFMS